MKFLESLDLVHLKKKFTENQLTMKDLLSYNEKELKNLGIKEESARRTILKEIKKIHYRNFSSNSLIPIRTDKSMKYVSRERDHKNKSFSF